MAIRDSSQFLELDQQFKTVKALIKCRSKSPPCPTKNTLNQSIKDCQMAMQRAIIPASENERLRMANEWQVVKHQMTRKFIFKETILIVKDTQKLVTTNIEVEKPLDSDENDKSSEIVVYILSPMSRPRDNQAGLTSYYVCNSYNHSANKCTKAQ
jgi:hypothetical protein